MAKTKMIYCGIFLDEICTFKNKLDNAVKNQHITIKYKPDEDMQKIIEKHLGEDVSFVTTGYGNDDNNEGYTVALKDASPEIMELFDKIPVPHITTGLANGAKAVDTGKLYFRKYGNRSLVFILHGKVGYFDGNEVIC